jgi:hypothetical protein
MLSDSDNGKKYISNIEVFDEIPNVSCSNAIFIPANYYTTLNADKKIKLTIENILGSSDLTDYFMKGIIIERVWVKFVPNFNSHSNDIRTKFSIAVYSFKPVKLENNKIADALHFRNKK